MVHAVRIVEGHLAPVGGDEHTLALPVATDVRHLSPLLERRFLAFAAARVEGSARHRLPPRTSAPSVRNWRIGHRWRLVGSNTRRASCDHRIDRYRPVARR